MTARLCAVCLLALDMPASLIVVLHGTRLEPIDARGQAFVDLFQRIRAGEHETYPPDAVFEVNQLRTRIDAVTAHHGTEVCAPHLWGIEDMWTRWSAQRRVW